MERLEELKQIFSDFLALPFPEGSDDETTDMLWAELVDYDAYIAGLVDRIIKGVSLENYKLYFDEKLERKLIKIVRGSNPVASRDAKRIMEYLAKIKEMVSLALKIISKE